MMPVWVSESWGVATKDVHEEDLRHNAVWSAPIVR